MVVEMNDLVTVDRFCAIEDTHCSKIIPFNGPWTFFLRISVWPQNAEFLV